MAHINAIDVSQWNGSIDWNAVKNSGVQIAIVKAGGADAGLYTDSKYNANYYGAKAAGLAVGIYYFAGPGSAINQADHFVSLASPLEQDDVLVLDWEIQAADPVGFCRDFAQRVHDRTGVWVIIYFNGSTWNAHDWSPVTNNSGVWVAWYGQDPEGNLPVHGPYIMHQYTSSGSVPGIAGRVDLDAVFMPLANFKKYGFQPAPAPNPAPPAPPPTPAPEPQPVPPPAPAPEPPKPTPSPPVDPTPPPAPIKDYGEENNGLLKQILAIVQSILSKLTGIFK